MRTLCARLAMLGILLCIPALLSAQDQASITGVVTDASGAAIAGVQVTLQNAKTGTEYKAVTNSQGSYSIPNAAPGDGYSETFSAPGFKTTTISGVYLSVGTTRTQSAKLTVGEVIQSVAVSAAGEGVTLDTTDATIGNNLTVEELNELPIYDRTGGITTLFTQQPGVEANQGAVAGARVDQTSVTIDGLDVNDIAAAVGTFAIVAKAPVDSVEQFTGTIAGLTPSLGTGGGAQFQLVTKSGTNQFHGNVNEYHRDTTTVANEWFNNLIGLPRTPLIRNQFGGNIGGPIKRDKLFFFFDLADSRIISSSTGEPTVPLNAFRNGELNYINSGPGCGDSSRLTNLTTQTDPCITTLTAGDIATLDPAGIGFNPNVLALVTSRYPEANDLSHGDGVNTGGYRFTYPTPDIDTTYVGRIDYALTSKQRIFGRFTINRENAVESLPEFPTDPSTHPYTDHSYAYVVSHTWTIGNNKVNQVYYGDNISKYSFPDLYNPTGPNQYSFSGINGPYTSFDGQQRRVPIPVVRDDFNWQIGNHGLAFGGLFKFIKTNSNLITNFNYVGVGLQGSAFSGGLTPSVRPADINQGPNNVGINDYDSLFASSLGVIGDISTNFVYNNKGEEQPLGGGSPRAYRYYQTEAYAGDTWKVNKKLTLSYGLRYQFYTVPYETHGSESIPTPINLNTFINDRLVQSAAGDTSNTGLPLYNFVLGGKANHGPNMYSPSYKDFAPRLAFAYSPYGSGKTVINGSASIVYDRAVINSVNFLQDQVPNIFANSVTNNFGAKTIRESLATDARVGASLAYDSSLNPTPLPATTPYVPWVDSTGTPFGLAAGETGFVISPNLKDPYSINFNAGVQQEFPGHLIMKLNYAGRLGRRLLADADANQVIDVPDYTGKSNQTMAQAFAGLTTDLRAGGNLRAEPWFEDVLLAYGSAVGLGNNTNLVAAMIGQLGNRGDISDSLYTMAAYSYYYGFTGFLPNNIGIPSQFGTNAYLTNMGNSNYHGLLLTVDKNLSQGLQFEMNYTWSHSIDNTSLSSAYNALYLNSGFICDILQPRACRGSSDFDVRQELTSNFRYDLPFGRGRTFLGAAPKWADEAIGGWSISGLPSYHTGLAVTPYSDAFLASFDNGDPAIFTGNKADLKAKVNVDQASQTVYGFGGGSDGANKVLAEFRGPLGLEYGQRNLVRGPGAFYFDAGVGKTFPIVEDKINLKFRADAFNVLNHPVFGTPALNIVNNASNFGQITATSTGLGQSSGNGGARVAQFSLRLEF